MAFVFRAQKPQTFIDQSNTCHGTDQNTLCAINNSSIEQKEYKNDPSFISKTKRVDLVLQNSLLGPGSYQTQCSLLSNHSVNKIVDCNYAFQSKIDRFGNNQNFKDKKQLKKCQQLFENVFQAQKSRQKIGKIHNWKIRQKNIQTKSIPSIPTWQQSYGYRINQQTNQLIRNKNPQLIMNKNKITQQNWNKNYQKCQILKNYKSNLWNKSNIQKNLLNINHIINNQSENYYKKVIHKYWKQKGNIITSKQQRFNYKDQSISIKDLLLLNRIKQKYKDFIDNTNQNKTLQQLELEKFKKENQKISSNISQSIKNKKQFFNSKISRFKQQEKYISKQNSQPKIEKQQISQKPKVQIPIGGKKQRFQQIHKGSLGPGSYIQSNEFLGKSGVTIKFEQSRFRDKLESKYYPGPGSYQIQEKPHQKNIIHKRVQSRRQLTKIQNSKENSMQILYGTYGRYVNYLLKQQNNNISKDKKQKKQYQSAVFRSKTNRNSFNISNPVEENNKKQVHNHQHRQKIIPKFKKPIHKHEPTKKLTQFPGPGQFQIARSLNKRSYNLLYN